MMRVFSKRLYRTLARIIPQCGMVAQAVAFNMFLAFFAVLVAGLSLMKRSLEGDNGAQVALRISAILPPGTWQLISGYFLQQEVKTKYLALAGWIGMVLVGTQLIKLIMKGIEMVHGEQDTFSFLGRQVRAVLLFAMASVVWFAAIVMSVFGQPIEQWIAAEFYGYNPSVVLKLELFGLRLLAMVLVMFVLALIYRISRRGTMAWKSVLPGAAFATILWWGLNFLFGIYVRKTQFGPVYGGLAAAIGLMGYMEMSATLVFFGAAWNLERTRRDDLL